MRRCDRRVRLRSATGERGLSRCGRETLLRRRNRRTIYHRGRRLLHLRCRLRRLRNLLLCLFPILASLRSQLVEVLRLGRRQLIATDHHRLNRRLSTNTSVMHSSVNGERQRQASTQVVRRDATNIGRRLNSHMHLHRFIFNLSFDSCRCVRDLGLDCGTRREDLRIG